MKTKFTFHHCHYYTFEQLMLKLVQYCYGNTTVESVKWNCMAILEEACLLKKEEEHGFQQRSSSIR